MENLTNKTIIESYKNSQSTNINNIISELIEEFFAKLSRKGIKPSEITASKELNTLKLVYTSDKERGSLIFRASRVNILEIADYEMTKTDLEEGVKISSLVKKGNYDFTKSDDVPVNEIFAEETKSFGDKTVKVIGSSKVITRDFANFAVQQYRERTKVSCNVVPFRDKAMDYYDKPEVVGMEIITPANGDVETFDYQILRTLYKGEFVIIDEMHYGEMSKTSLAYLCAPKRDLVPIGKPLPLNSNDVFALTGKTYTGLTPNDYIEKLAKTNGK